MSEQITHKDVEWERAACQGIAPDLFYTPHVELLDMGFSYRTLRRVCFACPIWKECLQVATAYEPYGFWGGLSEDERRHLYNGTKPRSLLQLKRDLQENNVSLIEITRVVKSVERVFKYSAPSQM